jgi:hypothetical protein
MPPQKDPHPRYLDEPFALERTMLEQALDVLRPLANGHLSPLPARMRGQIARMYVTLAGFTRELRDHPDALTYERADEDAPPPLPTDRP